EDARGTHVPDARILFYVPVRSESEWSAAAEFAKRFVRAFKRDDGACFAIGLFGEPVAETAAARVERIFVRANVDPKGSADVVVSDESDYDKWKSALAAGGGIDIADLQDRSPSALRRFAER